MIMTDGTHLVATESLDELHAFARTIGLKQNWFQNHRIPHYDLFGWRILREALEAGAQMSDPRDLVSFAYRPNRKPRPITWTARPQLQADIAGEGE